MLFKLFSHDEVQSSSSVRPSKDFRRWIVLSLFCLYSSSNAIQWITFAPIATNVIAFFNMTTSQLNLLSSVYMIIFAAGAYFTCTTFENWGVRKGLLIGTLLNALGSILKVAPGLQYPSYASMMGPQVLNALAQLFVLSTPPLIAAQYFEPHQRAFATAVASTANNIGNAIALAIPPVIVREGTHNEFMLLFCLEMGYCVLAFISIILFLQPPSYSSPTRALLLHNGLVPTHNNLSINDNNDNNDDDDDDDEHHEQLEHNDNVFEIENQISDKRNKCLHNKNVELRNGYNICNSENDHGQQDHNSQQDKTNTNNATVLFHCNDTSARKKGEEREELAAEEKFDNSFSYCRKSATHNLDKGTRERYYNGTNNESKLREGYSDNNTEANTQIEPSNQQSNQSTTDMFDNDTRQEEVVASTFAKYSTANKSVEGNIEDNITGNVNVDEKASNMVANHKKTNKLNECEVGSASKRKRLSAWRRLMMNAHVVQFLEVGHVIGQLMRRRDFVFLLLAFSISMGSVWTFASVLAQILEPFGVSATAAGLAGALNVVVGTIAAYLVGFWVDQSHRFKWPLVTCLAGSIVCCVGLMCVMWRAPAYTNFMTYMSCAIYIIAGIFQNTAVPICFEFAMEITYPLAESVPGALLMAAANVIALVLLSAASAMLGDGSASHNSCLYVLLLITCICIVGLILSILPREHLHRQKAIADAQSAAHNAPEEEEESSVITSPNTTVNEAVHA